MGDPRPIGIFDSGVGGLTVLSAIRKRLPHEPTIYLADLFHFPYGPRYQDEVRGFAFEIIRYLEARDVKLVVIAFNTATAAALNQAREHFEIPIVGVISPGAQAAVDATQNHRVGVISTEGTMRSQEYLHAIKEIDPMIGRRSPNQFRREIVGGARPVAGLAEYWQVRDRESEVN